MKKLVMIASTVLLLLSTISTAIIAKSDSDITVEAFYNSIRKSTEKWKGTDIDKGIKILNVDDQCIGELYRVMSGNSQKGYIIYLIGEGVVEARFEGNDRLEELDNKVYYLFPGRFLTKDEVKEYVDYHGHSKKRGSGLGFHVTDLSYTSFYLYDWDKLNVTYYINTTHVPDLDHNVETESSSLHYAYRIKDVPDYLNEVVTEGCAPTATAMLLAYYDNEWHNDLSTFEGEDIVTPQGIYRPKFSMQAQDNNGSYSSSAVENLINELALDMNTCYGTCEGTYDPEWSFGLSQYLTTHNHGDYKAILSPINDVIWTGTEWVPNTQTVNEYYDYQALIRTGNPAVLMVGAGEYGGGHVVLGIGYYQCQSSPGVIVYDDLSHGESWISLTYVERFGFIYD